MLRPRADVGVLHIRRVKHHMRRKDSYHLSALVIALLEFSREHVGDTRLARRQQLAGAVLFVNDAFGLFLILALLNQPHLSECHQQRSLRSFPVITDRRGVLYSFMLDKACEPVGDFTWLLITSVLLYI